MYKVMKVLEENGIDVSHLLEEGAIQ